MRYGFFLERVAAVDCGGLARRLPRFRNPARSRPYINLRRHLHSCNKMVTAVMVGLSHETRDLCAALALSGACCWSSGRACGHASGSLISQATTILSDADRHQLTEVTMATLERPGRRRGS